MEYVDVSKHDFITRFRTVLKLQCLIENQKHALCIHKLYIILYCPLICDTSKSMCSCAELMWLRSICYLSTHTPSVSYYRI